MANCPLCGQMMGAMSGSSNDPLANIPDEPQGIPLNALRANPGQLFGSAPGLGLNAMAPQQFFRGAPPISGPDLRKLFGY